MRLIDADELMKKIREVDFVADAEQMKITHDSMMTGFFHGRVQGIVDYLPTAYDPDKVVEQLEVAPMLELPKGWECLLGGNGVILKKSAIEIVKKGGLT